MRIMKMPDGSNYHRKDEFRIGPNIYKVVARMGRYVVYTMLFHQMHYNMAQRCWEPNEKWGKKARPTG